MGPVTTARCLELLVLAIANSCLLAHVFLLNDWGSVSADLEDPNRAARVFAAQGISGTAVAILSASLLAISLLLFAFFGAAPLLLALAVAILSALYSSPWFGMKGIPFANSALHVIGGLVHFLLGYSLFHAPDARSMLIGSFFALTFAAGHLTHEVRDCMSDKLNGIQTNAVRFGPSRTFVAGFMLFTAADVLLLVLAAIGMVPRMLLLVACLYPLHLWWTVRAWNAGLGFENIRQLQLRYRTLYAIIGVVMALATRL
jgi:4-hydroxybenzoate polyprenyltransferase